MTAQILCSKGLIYPSCPDGSRVNPPHEALRKRMEKIIALLLVSYATQVAAHTYLQRFRALVKQGSMATTYGVSPKAQQTAHKLVQLYPWLAHLDQPTAVLRNDKIRYRFEIRMERLPPEFYSHERNVLAYADGTEVSHLKVSETTPDYEQFQRRVKENYTPVVASIRDRDGVVQGEYLYIERGVNYLHDVFSTSESGFRFESFLERAESPVVNVAAGGFHFAWQLSRLNIDRQEKIPHGQRKNIHVFSFDISGAHQTFVTNPWYLFGDMYATGLPDDTFGAVITLGGPLNRRTCPSHECVDALRELGRIATPRGRLLIEYSMHTVDMIFFLEESGLKYLDFFTYNKGEHPLGKPSRPTQLIEILLDKD